MAFALVSHVAAKTTDGNTFTSGAIDTTGADLIAFFVAAWNGAAAPAVTDNKSNTYVALTSQDSGLSCTARWYYVVSPTVGSGHTFSLTLGSPFYGSLIALAFSSVKTTSPFDVENGAGTTAATTLATGSITPSEDNELVLAGLTMAGATASATINGGFTVSDTNAGSGFAYGSVAAYLIQTTATAANPTWTANVIGELATRIASFKAAAAAAGQPTMRRWGGVPHVAGGQQFNAGERGRMWGLTRSGLIVPQRLGEAA